MSATLQDLIAAHAVRKLETAQVPARMVCSNEVTFEPEPTTATPLWLLEAFRKIDALSARCDALIERNGVWTRYRTEGDQ
jgi:hypothetical protein